MLIVGLATSVYPMDDPCSLSRMGNPVGMWAQCRKCENKDKFSCSWQLEQCSIRADSISLSKTHDSVHSTVLEREGKREVLTTYESLPQGSVHALMPYTGDVDTLLFGLFKVGHLNPEEPCSEKEP